MCVRNCPLCNKEIKYTSHRCYNNAIRKNIVCASCAGKKVHQNPEYKEKLSKQSKELWQNPEYREKQQVASQKKWQNPEYKEKQKIKQKEIRQNPEYKEKLSKQSKELWQNPEYRNTQIKKQKEVWQDKEKRKEQSKKIKKCWQDSQYKEKMSTARLNQSGKVSSIQKILYSILDDLEIPYYREWDHKPNDKECRINWYNFDCIIPRQGKTTLLIECQGDYWHSIEKNIRNDKAKSTYIKKYYPEYEIKYLWEHEFSCKEKIIELIKYWTGKYEYNIINYNFKDLIIKNPKAEEYKLLLSKYHYLPNAGRGGTVYGVYFNKELISVVVFSSPIRQNININNTKFIELSRFCIHPKYQKKNLGSYFISKTIKLLKEEKPDIKVVVSYCDTTFNHDGALYKSLNFKQDRVVPADYWYIDKDNYIMHKKTLYNRATKMKMKESEFAEKYNYKKVYGKEKLRFILEI